VLILCTATAGAADFGVYLRSVEKAAGSFDETVQGVEKALGEQGWLIVASYEVSVPDNCGLRAHTIAVHSPTYAEKLLARGVRAAFALPVRIVVYEDENGTHAAFMNPSSVNRTVLGDGVAETLAADTAAELSAIVAGAAGGTKVDRQAGQMRSKGRVSGPKMMGGGKFDDRVEILFKKAAGEGMLEEIAGKVKAGIEGNTAGWELVYTLDLLSQGAIVLGVNSKSMEARAYGIAGEKRRSNTSPCPGIDHAAAFPIEIVVMEEGASVKVAILDGMYRMKLYFEDAGKLAFAKNMTMPGSIEKEIRRMALAKLK
jgi:uncharacterized protein (DUF302 family)